MSQEADSKPAGGCDIPKLGSGLRKLFDNSTGDKSNAVDYVLIHGFNGSSETTWLHQKPMPKFFWPKQLEADLKESRVFLYGYDATLRMSLRKNYISIGDIAESLCSTLMDERGDTDTERRPIVFVAHSLGGLVLKRAVFDMHHRIHSRETMNYSTKRLHKLYESISGLIFYGTPHLGSRINEQNRVQILAGLVGSLVTVPKNLTKALESESLELVDLSKFFEDTKLFTDMKIPIRSFYETMARGLYGAEVTTKASATLHYGLEEMFPIQRTHEEMVKFASPDDEYYRATLAVMRRYGQDGLRRNREPAHSQIKVSDKSFLSSLPQDSNPIFSGRKSEMVKIDEVFQNSKPLHQRVVLFGLGGIGKSQIAHEYAQRQSKHRSIFWVRANTAENIELGYVAIARLLKLDAQHGSSADCLPAVKGHLEDVNTPPWLLVLDGADEKEILWGNPNGINMAKYIPTANHGRVLITSRDSRVAGLGNGRVVLAQNGIRIGPMDFEDGCCLFKNCMRPDQILDVSEDSCRSFLDLLGGLPLAIVQGASYMREEEISIEVFIGLYKDVERHKDLFRDPDLSTDEEAKSVLCTWELSYARIAGPLLKSPEAMLLDVLAFLDAQQSAFRNLNEIEYRNKDFAKPIIASELQAMKPYLPPQKSPLGLLESIYNRQLKTETSFSSAIARLCNYSLIGSRECWVHPVVHSWIYRRLLENKDEICKYIKWMAEELREHVSFLSSSGWENFVIPTDSFTVLAQRDLGILRHVDIVLKYALSPSVKEYMTSNNVIIPEIGELLYRFGVISVYSGKASEGVEYLQQSILAPERSDQGQTSMSERKLCLAQAKSRLYPGEKAVAEARLCYHETSSLEAEYWLAQCLKNNGQLQDALAVLKNIIKTHPITRPQQFERKKVRFMATVSAAAILVDLGDGGNKTQARHLIDEWILPFLEKTPYGHVLNAVTYPQILISRIEASSDRNDRKAACKAVVDFETKRGTSADPREWLSHLKYLEQKWKLQEIVTLTKAFTRKRPPISDYIARQLSHPDESKTIDEQIMGWCEMYNFLGEAYFELEKFHKAEEAHRNAIALHLSLHSEGSESPLFQTNVTNLIATLRFQGEIKSREVETMRTSSIIFCDYLNNITDDYITSDHERQRGNRLILHWVNEEFEYFGKPEGLALMNTT